MPPISTMAAGVALDENCMCDSHRVSTLVLDLREGATFRNQSCHKRFLHQLETEKELCLITLFNFSLGQHHHHLSKWHLLCAPLTGDLGLWSCGASEIAPKLPDQFIQCTAMAETEIVLRIQEVEPFPVSPQTLGISRVWSLNVELRAAWSSEAYLVEASLPCRKIKFQTYPRSRKFRH